MFTQVIIRKRKTDGCTTDRRMDGQMDRHMDVQRETIIPHHYIVAGYKKTTKNNMLYNVVVVMQLNAVNKSSDFTYI